MRDFTIEVYRRMLDALMAAGYEFQTFAAYLETPAERAVILRHDVDRRPGHSVRFARIEAELGIRGTYYFRIREGKWEEKEIREIHRLGHEVGYHYETMHTAGRKSDLPLSGPERGPGGEVPTLRDSSLRLTEQAYLEFCRNLESLRKLVPVATACMHGSPLSRHDNREIWKKYDYRALGIAGEPYFDLDTSRVAYLTDTGRMWDGERFSVRDKMNRRTGEQSNNRTVEQSNNRTVEQSNNESPPKSAVAVIYPPPAPPLAREGCYKVLHKVLIIFNMVVSAIPLPTGREGLGVGRLTFRSGLNNRNQIGNQIGSQKSFIDYSSNQIEHRYHTTFDLIEAIGRCTFPERAMLTIHPQRWTDNFFGWTAELVMQRLKNGVKGVVAK